MRPMTVTEPTRVEVRVPDGTDIAVFVQGHGPALVLVHGSIADHTTLDPLVAALRDDVTCYAMDRRGFGGTADRPGYTLERDFDDVAAVVDAVAARTHGPVALWGHSYGANCALGAAALTRQVGRLILYEPSLGLTYRPGSIEAVEAALARGDREGAITTVLMDALGMTEDEIAPFRENPLWPTRLAAAPTIPRECRAEQAWVYPPGRFDSITAPTLFLTGSDSVPDITAATHAAAAALPDARIRILDGHGHFAHRNDPAMVAALVREFIGP
jgi:pimeloyl-ACP methyl ester carboxylesterase